MVTEKKKKKKKKKKKLIYRVWKRKNYELLINSFAIFASLLLLTYIRYLQVERSPFKVYVARVLAHICHTAAKCVPDKSRFRLQMVAALGPLLDIMQSVHAANSTMLWGCSPLLTALVDLCRVKKGRNTIQGVTRL